jgi:hypothetical protein
MDRLTDKNFLLYAAKHYDSPHFDHQEFTEDVKRLKYLKRLFNKYQETGKLKERLILNHLIIFYNVFGAEAGTKLLFLRLKDYYVYLKPFLVFLNFMPEIVTGVRDEDIISSDIPMDPLIVETLRKLCQTSQ